jgi:hypothetical protein
MMRRAYGILLTLSIVAVCGRSLSQQPSAFLQGTVVEAGSAATIAKATVELRSVSGSQLAVATTRTDGEGKFYLPNVAPGSYRLVAIHAGHVTAEYGQRQPGVPGTALTLTPNQRITDVRIAMTAAGIISGHIIDKGQPIGQADAIALKAIYTEGQLSFTPVLSIRTDDLGEYSLFWLPPGRYYMVGLVWDSASSVPRYTSPDGTDSIAFYAQRYIGRAVFLRATAGGVLENEAHIPMYYPGTPDPKLATVIDVQPGAVLRGIDIDASAVPTRHVTGRIVGIPTPGGAQAGQPVRVTLNLRPLTPNLNNTSSNGSSFLADSSGNFEISNAVPGRYVLMATVGNLTGRTPVEIRDRDVTDLVISLSPGLSVTGRVVIERATSISPDPAIANLRIVLRNDPLLPGSPNYAVSPQPDGSFSIPAMPTASAASGAQPPAGPIEGDYRVLVTPILVSPTPPDATPPAIAPALQNLYVKSIRMGDIDILNDRLHLSSQPQESLTITIGSNAGTLNGRVVDDRQQPAPGTTVVLIHDNGLRYRVNENSTFSDPAGRFELQSVPPGDYKLFAWEKIERGAWQDPEFMRPFEDRGLSVHVEEGGKVSVDVQMIATPGR